MAFKPLTEQQFNDALKAGFSPADIIHKETIRKQTSIDPGSTSVAKRFGQELFKNTLGNVASAGVNAYNLASGVTDIAGAAGSKAGAMMGGRFGNQNASQQLQQARGQFGSSRNLPVFGQTAPIGVQQGNGDVNVGKSILPAVGAAADIVGTIDAGLSASKMGEEGFGLAKSIFKTNTDSIGKAVGEAVDITRPLLSKSEEAAATAAGRKSAGGVLGKVTLEASPRDIEVGKAAQGIVSKGKSEVDNISALRSSIDKSVKFVRSSLEKSQAIWNKNLLKSSLDGVDIPITVKSDASLAKQAENIKSAVLDIAEKANKKTVGLLDTRQEFDKLIAKEYPNLYEKEQTPIRQYIRSLRKAINDFAESQLQEGKLPNGEKLTAELKKQHLWLEAVDNISEKAPKAGTTGLGRFLKSHPTATKAIGGTLGAIGLGAIGGEAIKHLP